MGHPAAKTSPCPWYLQGRPKRLKGEERKGREGSRRDHRGPGEVQLCLFPLVYTHITCTYPSLSLPCFSCRGQLWQRLQRLQTQRGQDVLHAAHRRAGSYRCCCLQSRTPGQAATCPTQPQCHNPSVPSSHVQRCKRLPLFN